MSESGRAQEIAASLARVRARIDDACAVAGRPAGAVGLTVVTKTFPESDVAILASLGVTDVGENRDQEAAAKHAAVTDTGVRWHMIGQLQRNKARSVARWADVVESVDRHALIEPLSRAAQEFGRVLDVLVQVSLDEQPGRGGSGESEVLALCDAVALAPGLTLAGVMAVAPHPSGPGDPAAAFARLARIHARVLERHPGATVRSAGMSGDLEAAIEHGATQVRVGGAILGNRPQVP